MIVYSLHYLCSLLRASADDLVTAEMSASWVPVIVVAGGDREVVVMMREKHLPDIRLHLLSSLPYTQRLELESSEY